MSTSYDRVAVWDEVADLYGEGISPFGYFSTKVVERAELSAGERVLDIGTGNGLALIPAAEAVSPGTAVGIDFSPRMIEAARRRADRAGVSNVELRQMNATQLEFPDESFDVLLASSVFHFLGYSGDVLADWRRVLGPGGRLVLSTPEVAHEGYAPMKLLMDLVEEHAGELPPAVQERVRISRGDGSPLPDVADLCLANGYRAAESEELRLRVVVADVDEWWNLQWSHGSRRFLREFNASSLEQMKREAAERLEPVRADDGSIAMVLAMILCRAVK